MSPNGYDIPRYMFHKKRYREEDMRLINKYEVNDMTINTKDMNYMMMAKELDRLRDKIAEKDKLIEDCYEMLMRVNKAAYIGALFLPAADIGEEEIRYVLTRLVHHIKGV